jgi:plastocyanin
VASALTVAALVAGCGEATRPPVAHTVVIDASSFSPRELAVRAGDTITWVNRDVVAHTATAASGRFDSQALQPGNSWSWQPAEAGVIDYRCTLHPTMTATLNVE